MKNILAVAVLIVFSFASQMALGNEVPEKVGLGFEFGTMFQSFQKSNFKNGGSNFFRLNMSRSEGGRYFLHNESGNISAEVGDATTTLKSNVMVIGSGITLGESFLLSLMVGNATLTGVAAAGTTTNAIGAIQSTSPVANICVNWLHSNDNVSLAVGLAYRYLTLSTPMEFTDTSGDVEKVNDMSSMNIDISISYSF